MAKLCEMKVTGKTSGTVVVANSIFKGKVVKNVAFNTVSQLKGALALENAGIIKIHGELPDNAIAEMRKKGNDPYSQQRFGKETDAPPAEAVSVKMPVPSTKKPEVDESAQPKGDFPAPSTENTEKEPELTEDEKGAPGFPAPETKIPAEENTVGSTRADFVEMTAKELKSHIAVNEIKLEGVSKMNATQLKNAVLAHYEMDELSDEEAN